MREIVHIQGGQCGNQIGAKFWEVSLTILIDRYFQNKEDGPNVVFVNLSLLISTLIRYYPLGHVR